LVIDHHYQSWLMVHILVNRGPEDEVPVILRTFDAAQQPLEQLERMDDRLACANNLTCAIYYTPKAVLYAGKVLRDESMEPRWRLKAVEIILLHGMPKGDAARWLKEDTDRSITITRSQSSAATVHIGHIFAHSSSVSALDQRIRLSSR
jgi:hypothetical protein